MINFSRIEKESLKSIQHWRNKKDLYKYFRQRDILSDADVIKWYESDEAKYFYMIWDDKVSIGVCGISHIDFFNRTFELSFFFKDSYVDQRAHEVIDYLLNKAFNEFNLHKAIVEVYDNDKLKKELCLDYGFIEEAKLRQSYFWDGKYYGSTILSLCSSEVTK